MNDIGKYYGKYKGYVRDNKDPEGRGRIRCYCPQVMSVDSDYPNGWLGWAEPCLPWMGGISTLDFGVPPLKTDNDGEETLVWLEFEAGNPDFPIWVGVTPIAPTRDGLHDKMSLAAAVTQHGGSLIANPNPGSTVDPLNKPAPLVGKEAQIIVKKGRDIFIGSAGGGGVIIGPSGVHITGTQVSINGSLQTAVVKNS